MLFLHVHQLKPPIRRSWYTTCPTWTELRGVPMDFIMKLIPQHAKKQCAFLGIWGSSSECSQKEASSSLEVTYILHQYYVENCRVAFAYSIIGWAMQPTVLLDGQCMLFSFTLAVMSHVCSTMAMSAFTTFCKADEDKAWSFPVVCILVCPDMRINSLHILFFLFGDGFTKWKKKNYHMYVWSGFFFLRLYQFSATIGIKSF